MPMVNATVTGSFAKATRTIGIIGVSMARAPVIPLSARVSEEVFAAGATGAEKPNLIPFRANSTTMKMMVATAVAAAK